MAQYELTDDLVQNEVSEPSVGGSNVETGRDVDAVRGKEKEKTQREEEWMDDDEEGGPRGGGRTQGAARE
jgi:hypothetical protein